MLTSLLLTLVLTTVAAEPARSMCWQSYAAYTVGFAGRIGLQCHAMPGDQRENLRRSLAAWRGYQAALAKP